jgi:hypothetical protein
MSRYPDESVTKLHADADGTVWYSRGIEAPQSSGKPIDTFLLSPLCSGKSSIFRIIGAPQNAELICSLFLRSRQREILAVELAGPNALPANPSALAAQQIVLGMSGITSAPSCGGWHEMTAADYNMYALIARLGRNNAVFDSPAHIYFGSHPISRWMAFIPTLSETDAAIVAATIVDPRWFVDRRHVSAEKNLFFYLGLTPGVQKNVSERKKLLTRPRELRCARVLAAWKSEKIAPEKVDLQNPANFLYRIWAYGGGGTKGDLRASQAFINYVAANWFESSRRQPGLPESLFAADLYFKTPTELKAYHQYAEALAE